RAALPNRLPAPNHQRQVHRGGELGGRAEAAVPRVEGPAQVGDGAADQVGPQLALLGATRVAQPLQGRGQIGGGAVEVAAARPPPVADRPQHALEAGPAVAVVGGGGGGAGGGSRGGGPAEGAGGTAR